MTAPTVLVVLAEGFEEIEVVTPLDLLRRAGAAVTLASLADGIHVTGRNGLVLHADASLQTLQESLFDCVVIPGGPAVALLSADPRVRTLLAGQYQRGGWIAAICAGPTVLQAANVLRDRRYTAHFSVAKQLPEALGAERVVVDGRLITSRGAGTAFEFGLVLVEKLFSAETAHSVGKSVAA